MNPVYALVGQALRSHRHAAGLTQQVVAERAGITTSFLSFLESGRKQGSLDTYHRLAAALRVPLTDLFRGVPRERDEQGKSAAPFGHLTIAETRAVWHLVRTFRRRKK